MGIPSVVYDISGFRDAVIHEKTGFRVNYGEISNLIKTIEQLRKSPARLREISEAARRNAIENYDSTKFNDYMLSFYLQIFQRNCESS